MPDASRNTRIRWDASQKPVSAAIWLMVRSGRASSIRTCDRRIRIKASAGDIASEDAGVARVAPPQFKQYREKDGRFYFKLTAGDGTLLIQSEGFDSPRDAGQLIAVIKQAEQGDQLQSELFKLGAEVDAVLAALAALREAA